MLYENEWSDLYRFVVYYENAPQFIPSEDRTRLSRAFRTKYRKKEKQPNDRPLHSRRKKTLRDPESEDSQEFGAFADGMLDNSLSIDDEVLSSAWKALRDKNRESMEQSNEKELELEYLETMSRDADEMLMAQHQTCRLFGIRSQQDPSNPSYGTSRVRSQPLVAYEYLKRSYVDKNAYRDSTKKLVVLPKETYNMIPIWLFPVVVQFSILHEEDAPIANYLPSHKDISMHLLELIRQGLELVYKKDCISLAMKDICYNMTRMSVQSYQSLLQMEGQKCVEIVEDIGQSVMDLLTKIQKDIQELSSRVEILEQKPPSRRKRKSSDTSTRQRKKKSSQKPST